MEGGNGVKDLLEKIPYTGLGFGTWIILGIVLSFLYAVITNLIPLDGPFGQVLMLASFAISLLMLGMVINTIFLKQRGLDYKVYRIGKPRNESLLKALNTVETKIEQYKQRVASEPKFAELVAKAEQQKAHIESMLNDRK